LRYFFLPNKVNKIYWHLNGKKVNVLDIGCGNHSATIFKSLFKSIKYYGVDKTYDYRNSINDFELMEKFYKIDLDTQNLNKIPNNFFDVIIFSHVIEHLRNGYKALSDIIKKLKRKGIIYLETPSIKSVNFPHIVGLNFYDDFTHIKPYFIERINKFLINNKFSIIEIGRHRSLSKTLMTPLIFFYNLFLTKDKNIGGSFWDIYGYAVYVIWRKN